MEWTRREALGSVCAGALSGPSIWAANYLGTGLSLADEDYRDCLIALATHHIAELESISVAANFHAIVHFTRDLNDLAKPLREDPDHVLDLIVDGLLKKPLSDAESRRAAGYMRRSANVGELIDQLMTQKSAFEGRIQRGAYELRALQLRLVASTNSDKTAGGILDWSSALEVLKDLKRNCQAISDLLTFALVDLVVEDLRRRLASVENFIDDCTVMVENSRESTGLVASLTPVSAAKVPSVKKCEEILSRFINPVLWWPMHVRGVSKPAFQVVNGVQADEAQRAKMITDALFCVNAFLARKCGDVAKELAKGG